MFVADRETGTFLERVKSVEEGLKIIRDYEAQDKEEGIYIPDFYDIIDDDHCSVMDW